MKTHKQESIRALLEDHELKVVLDSPKNDYRFEYYTTASKDPTTNQNRFFRTYRVLDLLRGGMTPEPWDSFDLDKQTELVTNLIEFSGYRISKVVTGWVVKCPLCGLSTRGKIWESIPKICPGKRSRKCGQTFGPKDVVEDTHAD